MSTLNLTRKFRINTFEEVVGQQLIIRMLKNSLYSDRLFPVYLFFGQHGCGKTSIARIFGMAINCKALPLFRVSPKQQSLPCLTCDSCVAMQKNSHLDFIEIDAASYTGVDNIRSIIESASYLPVIGSKKIYLIDEAHMLSKAAFNALLKILEEPPANVLFMLATTDVEKIIETVRSRCFQLFLRPISVNDIHNRLTTITQSENIPYNQEALWTIAGQANGSVRDALNLVERVRCAYPKITVDAVYHVLGKVSDQCMGEFFVALYEKNSSHVIELLSSEPFFNATPTILWRHIFQLLRVTWYAKHGIEIDEGIDKTVIHNLKKTCSLGFLGYVTAFLYRHEIHFLKTHAPRFFIEHLFTLIAMRTSDDHENVMHISSFQKEHTAMINQVVASQQSPSVISVIKDSVISVIKDRENIVPLAPTNIQPVLSLTLTTRFVEEIKTVVNPMIHSLFSQALFIIEKEHIIISLPQSVAMLKELLKEAELQWLPTFKHIFGSHINHSYQFTEPMQPFNGFNQKAGTEKEKSSTDLSVLQEKKNFLSGTKTNIKSDKKNHNTIDFSDALQWPQVNLILKYFPGTATFIEQ